MRETRTCTKCGIEQPVDGFTWQDKAHRRRDSYCKKCRCAMNAKRYRDPDSGYRRRCQQNAKRQQKSGYCKEYYKRNRDRILLKYHDRYHNDQEFRARALAYFKAYRERKRASST